MKFLNKDPIVELYSNFSANAIKGSLPVFSETVLRLACSHVLKVKRTVDDEIINLYKKLLLINYSETSKSLKYLNAVMPCFSEREVLECFNDLENIQSSWKQFTLNQLIDTIRKSCFIAVYSEWVRRYIRMYKELNMEELSYQADQIFEFFNWQKVRLSMWKRSFQSTHLELISKDIHNELVNYSEHDLLIENIVADLQNKLHPLAFDDNFVEFTQSEYVVLPEKMQKGKRKILSNPTAEVKKFKCSKNSETELSTQEIVQEINEATDGAQIVQFIEYSDSEDEYNVGSEYLQSTDNDEEPEINNEFDQYKNNEIIEATESDNSCTDSIALNEQEETDNKTEIIDDKTATKYLAALQAYAVVNGLFGALNLLDQVDSLVREKLKNTK